MLSVRSVCWKHLGAQILMVKEPCLAMLRWSSWRQRANAQLLDYKLLLMHDRGVGQSLVALQAGRRREVKLAMVSDRAACLVGL